ncbi:40S ribosomal protein, variant 2 [Dionaea muscipula]
MFTAMKKIQKAEGVAPSEFEETVGQALFDLENSNSELKSDLKDLFINSAVQIDVSGSRKAVVIHVPYRLRKAYRKIHVRLVRELEKKFSGKVALDQKILVTFGDVVLISTRKIMRPPRKGSAVKRPRSRTLTSVHENILEDIVQPAEIVGKFVRYRLDGSKIIKVIQLTPRGSFVPYFAVKFWQSGVVKSHLHSIWILYDGRSSWIPRPAMTPNTSLSPSRECTESFAERT